MSESTTAEAGGGNSPGANKASQQQQRHHDETPVGKKKKKKGAGPDNKWKRRVGFAGLCLGVVMSSAVFSLLAPFYPDVAANNGLSEGMIGFIFAIFAFMVMMMSPYLGVKMDDIGSRKMMVYGLGLLGISTVAFSVLDAIPSVHSGIFIGISILLRILQGVGAAGSETASYALAAQLYPDDLSYAVGVMETLCSFGYMIGPPVGGLLFQTGGFALPFLVVGALAVATTVALHVTLPRVGENGGGSGGGDASGGGEGEEEGGDHESHTFADLWKTIKNPGIAVVASMAVVANGSYALLEPTLEPFVEETFEDFNQAEVGLLFFLISLVYAAACPLSGWAASRHKALKLGPEIVMMAGMAIIAVALLLLGPSPALPMKTGMLSLTVVSLMMVGLGQSMASVPNMDSMLGFCDDSHSTKSVNTVSGILNAAYSLGGILGPMVGSLLTTWVGFRWATTIWSLIIVIQCTVMVLTLRAKKRAEGGGGVTGTTAKVARSVEMAKAADAIDGVFTVRTTGGDDDDGVFAADESDTESDD